MNRFLSRDAATQLLQQIKQAALPAVYDYERHRMVLLDETGREWLHLRLPIVVPPPEGPYSRDKVRYVMLLIQAGNCAIGYFEDGINLDHKVFRAYMVRKKQGTSQIKHLKTKGKSRAGSRVRLAETMEFFESINERLQQYFAAQPIDRIALSCSKTLLPYLFDSKVATPFDKRDARIFKIPRHVHTPIYEVLLDTHKFLLKGELIFDEADQEKVHALLGRDQDLEQDESQPL